MRRTLLIGLAFVVVATACGGDAVDPVCDRTGRSLADAFITIDRVTGEDIRVAIDLIDSSEPEAASPAFQAISDELDARADDLREALESEDDSRPVGLLRGMIQITEDLSAELALMAESTSNDDLAGFVEANGRAVELVQTFAEGSGPGELRSWMEDTCPTIASEVTAAVGG